MKSSLPTENIKRDLANNETWGLRVVELQSSLHGSNIALATIDLQDSLMVGIYEPDNLSDRKAFNDTLKDFSGYYYDDATFKAEKDSSITPDFTDDNKIAQCLINCIFTVFYTGDNNRYSSVINKLRTLPAEAWVYHKDELKAAFLRALTADAHKRISDIPSHLRGAGVREGADPITDEFAAAMQEANAVIEQICKDAKKELEDKKARLDAMRAKKMVEGQGSKIVKK